MSEIELAFTQENLELLRLGKKHATTRRSRHGAPGDTFRAGNWTWRIESIVPVPLRQAAATVFMVEGFPSRDAFLACWERCYAQRDPPDLTQIVYVHYIARILPNTEFEEIRRALG